MNHLMKVLALQITYSLSQAQEKLTISEAIFLIPFCYYSSFFSPFISFFSFPISLFGLFDHDGYEVLFMVVLLALLGTVHIESRTSILSGT